MRAAWDVAKRELLDGTLTWKVPLTFALTLVLVVTGALTLADEYEDRVHAYALSQNAFEADGEDASAAALAQRFLAQPNVLGVLVGGPGEDVRRAFGESPHVTNATVVPAGDPMALRFSTTDLVAVAVGVLSLVALLLAHDAIAGEKERGTLKILLVNPITRAEVLAGKALGAWLGAFLPVLVAAVTAVLLLERRGVPLVRADYVRLGLVLAALAILLLTFVLVGLAVSAFTHRTGVAVVAALFVWLVLVSSAGSLAVYAAEESSGARPPADVLAESRAIDAHYEDVADDLERAIRDLERKRDAQNGTLSKEDAARLEGLRRELAALPLERAAAHDALVDATLRHLEFDLARAEQWARFSPAEAFRSAAQSLARTDYATARDQMDAFSVYLREVRAMREEHAEATAGDEDPEPFQPPPLRHAPASVERDVSRAMPFLAALVTQAAVAFALAAVGFARYDAR